MKRLRGLTVLGVLVAGCVAAGEPDADVAPHSDLTTAQKEAVCNAIPAPRPWTAAESQRLLESVVRRFSELKRDNDALIAERGVGRYAGVKTDVMKALDAGNLDEAARLLRPHLRRGHDARSAAKEIQGTSCIGRVYSVLREAYAELGRGAEWGAIEKCGRAWESDGLHVQQALIRNGWPAPTLPFVSDEARIPGSPAEVAVHREFLRAVDRGSYFGTPVSTTVIMSNFLPSPGSTTRADEAMFLAMGRSRFLGFATLRGAFHVPLIVPAASVAVDLAPSGPDRAGWVEARDRGEPFVMESHSLRQPWDPTNFEIRPLSAVIRETFGQSVTYATGTILFSPFSESPLDRSPGEDPAGCMSSTLNRRVPLQACVLRPSDERWFRCVAQDAWAASSADDPLCASRPSP